MLRFCAGQVRRTALLGDKGCGADWFRQALTLRSIIPSISLTTNRKTEILFDKKLRKTRHKTENKFGRL